ncbi:MAG: Flp pilus assembly protein CpaB [Raoultibacter sp.]
MMRKRTNREHEVRGNAPLLSPQVSGEQLGSNVKMLSRITAFSVIIAIAAIVFSLLTVGANQNELNTLKASSTPSVVAKTALPQGTTITADLVETIDIPTPYVERDCATTSAEVIGKITAAAIPEKGQINKGALAGEGNVSSLAAALEAGTFAASVAVDAETGLAGLLRQGDRVDILAEGRPIVENVRVVALDGELDAGVTEYSTATLQVALADAQALQIAQMNDPLRLILHSAVRTNQ